MNANTAAIAAFTNPCFKASVLPWELTPILARGGRCRHRPASWESAGLLLRELEPGIDDGVGVQRHRFDALVHQPLGEVRVVARALAADADVLALRARGLD